MKELVVFVLCLLLAGAAVTYADPVQWKTADRGNGHYYEVIVVRNGISWWDAKAAAEHKGGHLATCTTQAENDFVFQLAYHVPSAWYQVGDNIGTWFGPWLGGYQPSSYEPDPSYGWAWVTGEEWHWTSWLPGEPNNWEGKENYLILTYKKTPEARWNDYPNTTLGGAYRAVPGYVVEYDDIHPNPD